MEGCGCSSDCQLWLEILCEWEEQVGDKAGMKAEEPLLLIRRFGPLFSPLWASRCHMCLQSQVLL